MTTEEPRSGILAWQRRMFNELTAVPEVLASLRETAANLKTVSDRLVLVTEALERTTRAAEETGLLDLLRRLDDASSSLRKAVAGDPGPALRQARALVDDVRHRVEALATRFLAGPPPLDDADDDDDDDDGDADEDPDGDEG